MSRPSRCLWSALLLLLTMRSAWAVDLIFGVPPLETQIDRQDVYRPIVDYLSQLLRRPIQYEVSADWLTYQRDMREGRYDLVFDGPHLVAWRIAHSDHEALVRLSGALRYVVVVRQNDSEINQLEDLISQRVCALAPPDLSALMLFDGFLNPARQPLLQTVNGGFDSVYEAFLQRRCVAAILPSSYYEQTLTPPLRSQARVLYTTTELPNQALTAGPRVSADDRRRIRAALSQSPQGNQASNLLRRKFAPNSSNLENTSSNDYVGYNLLLEGVVFGW